MARVIASDGIRREDGTYEAIVAFTESPDERSAQHGPSVSYLAHLNFSSEGRPRLESKTDISNNDEIPFAFLKTGDRTTHILMIPPTFSFNPHIVPLNPESCQEPPEIPGVFPEEKIYRMIENRLPKKFRYSKMSDSGTYLKTGVLLYRPEDNVLFFTRPIMKK